MESGSVSIWRNTAGGDFVEFTLGKSVSSPWISSHRYRCYRFNMHGTIHGGSRFFASQGSSLSSKQFFRQGTYITAHHEEERSDTDLADGVCFRLPSIGTRICSQVNGDGPCGLCFRTNSDKHLGVYGEKTGTHFTTKAEYWPSWLGLEGFYPASHIWLHTVSYTHLRAHET